MEKFNQNHKIIQHFETAPSLPKSKPFSSRLLKNYTITDYTVGDTFSNPIFEAKHTPQSQNWGNFLMLANKSPHQYK